MKIDGMISNMCLSKLMVEMSGYDFPRTNKGRLRRTLARWSQHYLGNVQRQEAIDDSCFDRRGIITNHKLILS